MTSLTHNNRENLHGNPDIILERVKDNITYVKSDIKELYEREFGQAVTDYNAKQKRNDRKIVDYYSKTLHDKKTHHQQELIVAVGKGEENTSENIFEMKKNILDNYMKQFQKRNPNLKIYNAVMHLDEANPHLHINFVPVFESKRGLSKRVGFDKAIDQQESGLNFETWRERETGIIEESLKENSIEREYKGSHDYLKVSDYKERAKVNKSLESEKKALESAKNTLKSEIREEEQTKYIVESELKALQSEFKSAKDLDNHHTPKADFMGKIPLKEYDTLKVTTLQLNSQCHELKKDLERSGREIEHLNRDNIVLETKLKDFKLLQTKNENLTQEVNMYKTFIELMGLEHTFLTSRRLLKEASKVLTKPFEYTVEQFNKINLQVFEKFKRKLDFDEGSMFLFKKSPTHTDRTLNESNEWDLDR